MTALVKHWKILYNEIPFCFHKPAKLNANTIHEQSLIPVRIIPNPITYTFEWKLPKKIVKIDIINIELVNIITNAGSFIFDEKNIIQRPPINYPTPSKMNKINVNLFNSVSDIFC